MKQYLFIMLAAVMLISCGESDLPESHEVVDTRVLALKVEPCEAAPGDSVTMTLLVGGKDMDQHSDLPVTWEVGEPGDPYYTIQTVPYHDPFQLDLPADMAVTDPPREVLVYAVVSVADRYYSALKSFRITPEPVKANPVITGVRADYRQNGEARSRAVAVGDAVTVDENVKYIAFTAQMADLPPGANDTLVYRWFITESSTSDHGLESDDDPSEIEKLLGKGGMAAPYRQSVMISLYGEDGDEKYQSGTYQVYLVVWDNGLLSENDMPDRLGTDYFSFSVKAM